MGDTPSAQIVDMFVLSTSVGGKWAKEPICWTRRWIGSGTNLSNLVPVGTGFLLPTL